MATTWELTYDGITRAFADWGIEHPSFQRRSRAPSIFTARIVTVDILTASLFTDGNQISILRDGVQWFAGRIVDPATAAGPGTESTAIEARDIWYDFENMRFGQSFKLYSTVNGVVSSADVENAHAFLFCDSAGALITVGAQIKAIVDWAAAHGANIQATTASTTLNRYMPVKEFQGTCAEALECCFAMWPDIVTWIDYSTTIPTFHCSLAADLAPTTIDMSGQPPKIGSDSLEAFSLKPLASQAVSKVVVKFESTNQLTVDGTTSTYFNLITQTAGDPTEGEFSFGALSVTIPMQGSRASAVSMPVTTTNIESGALDYRLETFWKRFCPVLAGDRVTVSSVSNAGRNLAGQGLDYLVETGSYCDWMGDVTFSDDVFTAEISYTVLDDAGNPIKTVTDAPFTVRRTVCNVPAPGQTLSFQQLDQSSEPIPTGFAQSIYDALSLVYLQGTLRFHAIDVGGTEWLGRSITLTNGRSDWTGITTPIQTVTEDLQSGQTDITIGPPRHVSPAVIIEYLRFLHWREVRNPPAMRGSGQISSGAATGLGEHAPVENTHSVDGMPSFSRHGATSGGATRQIVQTTDANVAQISLTHTPAGAALRNLLVATSGTQGGIIYLYDASGNLRTTINAYHGQSSAGWQEIYVCIDDGTGTTIQKRMKVLGTDPY